MDRDDALDAALQRIGDRWTLRVIQALEDGPLRFADLEARIEGIAPNVLSKRLRQLETDGLVVATPYSERPPRFDYRLTGAGRDLDGALTLLAAWGAQVSGRRGDLHHGLCGTPLVARLWCPTCDVPVERGEPTGEIRA